MRFFEGPCDSNELIGGNLLVWLTVLAASTAGDVSVHFCSRVRAQER